MLLILVKQTNSIVEIQSIAFFLFCKKMPIWSVLQTKIIYVDVILLCTDILVPV